MASELLGESVGGVGILPWDQVTTAVTNRGWRGCSNPREMLAPWELTKTTKGDVRWRLQSQHKLMWTWNKWE